MSDKPSNTVWTFLTNHGHVLICLASDSTLRLRDIADMVGITERAVQRIVTDLEEGGYIRRIKEGRRNHYKIMGSKPMRHPVEAHCNINDLISMVMKSKR